MRSFTCRCGDVTRSVIAGDESDAAELFARVCRNLLTGDGPWLIDVQDDCGGAERFEVSATSTVVYVAIHAE